MDQNYTNNQCCELSPRLKLSHDKQVSSESELSTIDKQSIFSTNRCSNIKRRLQVKPPSKAKTTNKPQINTRTNRVYNIRHNFEFFVASKHKRKSFNNCFMPSLPSLSSSLFAQYLALVAICCIVATLTLNFANLLQAPNNFVSANDDIITTSTTTGKRFMMNNNHNHNNHHQHQQQQHQQQQHRYHHHHQTSPANLQPKNFNNLRHDRESRHKIEQSNEISAHLFTHNHNYNKLKSLSQQVPEQLPIVVSLSDNSYVSASPVESSTITTSTTTQPTSQTTTTTTKIITTSVNEQISPHQKKKHRTRYLLQHLSSSNSFSSRKNDDIGISHHRLHQKKYHRQRPSMHVYNNDLLVNKPINSINDVHKDVGLNKEKEVVVSDEAQQQQQQQLTSTSDISTTATTTQRNRHKYSKNIVQMFDSSDPEDQDQDEAIKHENLGAHYRIKSAAIIKTRESIDMGATFLNYTIVTNLNACLVECWITDSCDTAIYQESPVDFNNNNSNNNNINNYINNVNININHLPDSSARSEEHYSLTSLASKSRIKRPSSSSSIIDEHKIAFSNNNNNDGDKYNLQNSVNENNEESLGESTVDDSESSGSHLDIKNNSIDNNDVNDDNADDGDDDNDDDDNGDDSDPIYDSNRDNKRSRSTLRYDTQPLENGFFICYLFECVKPDGFKCQFSAHNYYTSATKRQNMDITTAAFTTDPEIGSIEPITTINSIDSNRPFVRNDISDKIISSLNNNETLRVLQDYYCGQNKFKCISQDQCIPNYSRCDGIFHCSDRSDEVDCNLEDSSVGSIGNHKTLDGYSIVMSDGSTKSDHILERTRSQSDHLRDSLNDKVSLRTPTLVTKHSNSDISDVQEIAKLDQELSAHNKDFILNDESDNVDLRKSSTHNIVPHYSNIISGHSNYHRINGKQPWQDSHIASIRMSQEEYNYGYRNKGNGMNSAIIAIMFGIGVTGMLVVIVGHKMKSIRKRIAYRGRRRSLVPDVDFLINTMPI